MASRIFIAGGYGLVGSQFARHIRALSKDCELVLAGRNPEKGENLARELGGASTARFDLGGPAEAIDLGGADLVMSAIYDPANALLQAAMARGIGHIGITTKTDDTAPVAVAALQSPPKRPVVVAGHCAGGVVTMAALQAAKAFSRIEIIELAAVFDERDPVGPATAGDAEMLVARALLRENGMWSWVAGPDRPRMVKLADGSEAGAYPAALLDVPSLAAATGAANVRIDLAQGVSLGTAAGGAASSDAYIDITGTLTSGERATRRTIVSDPKGLMHLTALGAAIVAERVLGLDGKPAAAGGLYLPETLISPDAAVARYAKFGVRVIAE